jgi:signal transduction histidine kinase
VERPLTTAFGLRLPSWVLDYGPVVPIVMVGLVVIRVEASAPRFELLLALAVVAIALVHRHRRPLLVLAVVLAVCIPVSFIHVGYSRGALVPVLLALFTVAEYSDRSRMVVATVVTMTAIVLVDVLQAGQHNVWAILPRLVLAGLAVAVGLYIRARADYVGGLHERAARLERERELLAEQAVADERVRIARELHDVVAHNVSLMVVQSQALAVTGEVGERRAALDSVADLGREALSEMHRMLDLLRLQNGGASEVEREPQPGVGDLDQLIARAREAGLDARLDVSGQPEELPPGVDLSAYRIVQEALTNVIRHADAGVADVQLRYGVGAIEVTVTDDGTGPGAVNGAADGHGLVGMRERAALFGGRLTTGAGEHGRGFRVHASLPLR